MCEPEEHWVFGYGSLMWRPSFDYEEKRFANIFGYHRSLCIKSHVHRGTPDKPGLVLGLDFGGACKGVCYRISHQAWNEVLGYLRAREQSNYAYRELRVPAYFGNDRKIFSLAYVVDRTHRQYAGRLDLEGACQLVQQGWGISGSNLEYIQNTFEHLKLLGLGNRQMQEILGRLGAG